ncbi:MAG: hypothetical protein V1658_03690 [Candidatus Micrarchaeota archaeon]
MRNIEVVLLFGAIAVLFAQAYYGFPATSDAYENFRIAKYLENGGNYPVEGAAIDAGPYVYPPIYPLALLEFKLLSNSGYEFASNFLSYVFVFLVVGLLYLILSGIFQNERKAALGALAAFTLPILIYRLVTPIAETLGLMMFLACVLAYQKNRFKVLAFLLAVFPFAHSRSFVFTLIALGIISLMRKDVFATAKSAVFGIAAFGIFHLAFPIYASDFNNPAVTVPSVLEMFPFAVLLQVALGAIALAREKRGIDAFSAGIIFAFLASYLILPFPFRHAIFMLLPLSVFAGEAMSIDRKVLIAFMFLIPFTVMQNVQLREAPFGFEAMVAMAGVGEYGGGNAIASFKNNYALPFVAEKRIIVGAFAEGMPDGKQRTEELANYFGGGKAGLKADLIGKYNIELGMFEKRKAEYSYEERVADAKLLESDGYAAFSFKIPA